MNEWLAARNILAVRLDNIGDVVMLGPALRAVKQSSPDARITLLASPAGGTATPLLPWVDEVITLRPVWQDVGSRIAFDPAREQELIAMLAARGFDAALIFTSFSQTPHVPGYVCYLAGIPLRAGEAKEFGGSTLTTELRSAPDDLHQTERNIRLVEAVGFTVTERDLAVAISDEASKRMGELLQGHGIAAGERFVLLHPGASAEARRYPAERFGAVAAWLGAQGWPVIVTGTAREGEMLATIQAAAPGAVILQDATTLPEYAALIERATLVICNDTLPMHLADAVNTPAVILYSGTDLESQWRPRHAPHQLLRRHTPCYPCYRFACPIGLPCLDIPSAEVVAATETLLKEHALAHQGGIA
jgi:ADP-heptose:LPS heptosyltransferase